MEIPRLLWNVWPGSQTLNYIPKYESTLFLQNQGQRLVLGEGMVSGYPLECGGFLWGNPLPNLFNIYMYPLAQLVQRLGLECHQHVDDTQLYSLMAGWLDTTSINLVKWLEAVLRWLTSLLRLNLARADVLWLCRGNPDYSIFYFIFEISILPFPSWLREGHNRTHNIKVKNYFQQPLNKNKLQLRWPQNAIDP